MILHLFYLLFNIRDKYSITIRLPKSKKYKNKVDPIYELSFCTITLRDDVFINKWVLNYININTFVQFILCLFIPYPINLLKFGYYMEDSVYICKTNEILKLGDDLKTIYENEIEKILKKQEIENKKRNEFKNKFETLNKTFNENYE